MIYNCEKEKSCTCVDGHKCRFYQGYMEGSSYSGFMVNDEVYFGDNFHEHHDAFMFTFGCVSKETNLFFKQKADGILGMGQGSQMQIKQQKPIWDAMMDDEIISKRMFSLCLGKNGGIFGIGGFNSDKHLTPVKWVNIHSNYAAQSYKFDIMGVSVNGHPLKGSHQFSSGFIDSGTTFSYLPSPLYDSILFHFDVFCDTANMYDNGNANKTKYCPSRI